MRSTRLLLWFLFLLTATTVQAQSGDQSEWQRVDALSLPAARVGVSVGHGTFRSYGINGPTALPSVATAALLSPRVSVQMEWTKPTSTFLSARASLHEQILSGAAPPTLIEREEQHSVRIPYHVAGLVGVHPPAWGRVQLGFLGGLSLAAKDGTVHSCASIQRSARARASGCPGGSDRQASRTLDSVALPLRGVARERPPVYLLLAQRDHGVDARGPARG